MDQVPRIADLLSVAVDAALADLSGDRRAARERHLNHGRWGDIIRGWGGQAAVIRARFAAEMMATRLDSSEGQELLELARSEYFAELPPEPQTAIGEVSLLRQVTTTLEDSITGVFSSGVIPAGVKIKRIGSPTAAIPRQDAEYQTIQAVACGPDENLPSVPSGDGNWIHSQLFVVPIEATRPGAHANHARYINDSALTAKVSTPLFDPFTVSDLSAAGGSSGVVSAQLRALARAMSTGSNGPTGRAAVAGSLVNPGVRRAVYSENPALAIGRVFAADESWAYSTRFQQSILQTLRSRPWIGWGCRVDALPVQNLGITVRPTVLLRSSDSLSAQLEITESIKTALLKYFDERPDFYTWTLNAIGGVVGGADRRILACTGVGVYQQSTGAFMAAVDEAGVITGSEPSSTIPQTASAITHYALVGQAVTPTYLTPGS